MADYFYCLSFLVTEGLFDRYGNPYYRNQYLFEQIANEENQ